MLSKRIQTIRDIAFDYDRMLRHIAVQEAKYTPDASKSRIMRHADAFCAVMDQMQINHLPGSRIAGNGGDKFIARPNHLLPEELEEIRAYPKACSPELIEALREEIFFLWPFSDGHIAPHFARLLETGVNGLLESLEKRLADEGLAAGQREFLLAARQEWEAVIRLAMRHAAYYEEKAAAAASAAEAREYRETAETIARVPAQPARTLREALQSVYFLHLCTQFDDVSNHSFGRFDQYMSPYYRRDIESGVITREEAEELFFEFWLKFTPGYVKSQKEGTRSEGQGFVKENIPENGLTWLTLKCISHVRHLDDGQTMDLAGLTEDGEDGSNEISRLAVRALDTFRTFEPKPVIKRTEKTDKAFLRTCYELLASGHGHPCISYHENGAAGLREYGEYDEAAVRDHCHIGCVELGIPGRSYTDPMNCFMNLPKVLLITMNGGTLGGKQLGLRQEKPQSFEEFSRNYRQQLAYFMDLYVEGTNKANPFYAQYFFRPLVSAAVDGCIDAAALVDEGGSEYWSKSMNCTGLATAADSLYAVKKLVYDTKQYTLEKLNTILQNDYRGEEALRAYLQNRMPKYGNGESDVDELAAGIARFYCDRVRTYRTYNGRRYRPGIYSFYETVNRMGRTTGATPNGRRAGERFSLNAAPDHGAIRNGIGGAMRSITSFPHYLADNACTADLHLSGGVPPEVIGSVSDYLARHGALFLQVSVTNHEDLLAAEKHPEDYRDLVVRVTGFSAQYVTLDEDTRMEILERSYWA